MITPSTSAPHGGLSNVDARHASRAESDGGFERELERGRERLRTREPETPRTNDAARTTTGDAQQARERAVDDDANRPHEPEGVSDAAEPDDDRADVSASDDAQPTRAVLAGSTTTSSARTTARGAVASAPDAADDATSAATLVPLPAIPAATTAASVTAPQVAPATVGSNTAPTPAGASESRSPAQPDVAPRVDGALGTPAGASVSPFAERPADTQATAAPSYGSAHGASAHQSAQNALALAARGTPATSDVAAPAPPPPVAVPRFTPAELPQFLRDLQVRVDGAAGSAFVELEPLELGRLTVELSLQPEGGVRAEVRAERPAGYAAIEARLPELRETLVGRGFATADVQVSLGLEQRDTRRETGAGRNARSRRDGARALDTERVLALAPGRDGSIDLWA